MITSRSQEMELLDLGPEYFTPQEFSHCQRMLFRINRHLGFLRNIRAHLSKLLRSGTQTIVDIGCGGGLSLLHLSKFFPQFNFIGYDISPEAIACAEENNLQLSHANVHFQLQETLDFPLKENSVDVVLLTLVCHHLTDNALIQLLPAALLASKKFVLIHDLHRHWLPQFIFAGLAPLLYGNRLITHDGLLSIKRSFKRKEWRLILDAAQIKHFQIKWRFPFYWEVRLWKA